MNGLYNSVTEFGLIRNLVTERNRGDMGKRGPIGQPTLLNRVYRIRLLTGDQDLLPFFQQLETLPRGRRNAALLAAIRGGQSAAQQELTRRESQRASQAIDHLLSAFED